MPETATAWRPRGAWEGVARPSVFGAAGGRGVTAALLDRFGLATLIAPPGGTTALSRVVEARIGARLPQTPRIVAGRGADVIWTGPEGWLLRAPSREGFAALLADLSPHAAVSDQSHARAAMRLSGPRLRDALAKGVMIDLHPAAFAVGDVAATSLAHIDALLWRLADGPDGAVFEIMAPRSMAGSFWSWFAASAAEFGCEVRAAA